MYTNILVPVALDHQEQAIHAIQLAEKLRSDGGKLTVLHVMEQLPTYVTSQIPGRIIEETKSSARSGLQEIADKSDVDVEEAIIFGHPGRTICDYAEDHGNDCIVIASHQPELADYLLGSTAARVVRHAGCSVHVIR
ncbi:MAG: universal stress protein [Pseudomonadota bacterium]